MRSTQAVLSLLALVTLLNANPVDVRNKLVPRFDPFNPCYSCFRSTWTAGPECTTDEHLRSTLSRVTNPPASATSTYTATEWCSNELRQTDWSTVYTTSSGVSTYTNWSITHLFVTKTDLDHPTSTRLCPIPSPSMECGWSNPNIIAPLDQGEDWSIEHYYNSTECQQVCLEHPACKAYRVENADQGGSNCEIFNVGIGVNGSNVISASKGGVPQWWDRDCPDHAPTECKKGKLPTATPAKTTNPSTSRPKPTTVSAKHPVPRQPEITPAPQIEKIVPREAMNLQKRIEPVPNYMSDLEYFWSSIYLIPACSCLITSAKPPTRSTTTSTVTSWTASTTVYTTYEDWFTVTTTPRETTIFVSVN
ncbi:uncharacterized protein BDR25DRAFT_341045 [Lindgomyces ingoldianus]|uniref:Uncharacterized protein n=1 Tax=Lindgomyces ingoldianus TaxID=673940 RepID=A0ACB6R4K9_9PLEO|nr:uncharacterized protein BDR25DRAFT_341045 [Lindgomyces ingoldianus]KAF2473768.1 hypothetical protein BDR25DRAFT_341045 [Lindgomyces ingoldianus]